jgi:predicted transcriptional regulator
MALQLSPELEQRVTALAHARRRDPQAVLRELVDAAEEEDAAFGAAVDQGITQLEAGHGISHEQAMERLRRAARGERPLSLLKRAR